MKKTLSVLITVLALSSVLFGGWEFDQVLVDYPELEVSNSWGMHSVVVDNSGNVWYTMYGITTGTYYPTATDTVEAIGIHAVDAAGDALSFSPIDFVTVGGVTDTLTVSCRGMTKAHDGNILVALGNGAVYKLNVADGTGMAKYEHPDGSSLTKPAVDDAGNIYVGRVSSGYPVKMLNSDLVYQTDVVTAFPKINRAIVVSGDGTDLYFGSTWTGGGVYKYHSDAPGILPHEPDLTTPVIGNWEPAGVMDTTITISNDTTIIGTDTTIVVVSDTSITQHVDYLWAEDVSMGPDGNIYAANTQADFSGDEEHGGKWFVFDTDGNELYSFGEAGGDYTAGGTFNGRGAAWSSDGATMYVAEFGYNCITIWTQTPTGVDPVITLPNAFTLAQNYPNPFNPSTSIPFELHQDGLVELTVFDVNGKEVVTLLNEQLNSGSHTAQFNGSDLSSGLYIYQLSFNGEVSVKNMLLVK
ncbi:MAG: T9SS type A sorting domain-containing protein [Candidatus Marinimicrobia bacterium]|nr:T9SS type A sorting domain-containing protein [Candidatus Neomarinimicrobiota bacterium]